ncbi:MAG: hypothetical protein PHQ25_08230, partial [Acidobacteriota bacterium]|nr:hypothetical protein [Acidobacteriota bacterium]
LATWSSPESNGSGAGLKPNITCVIWEAVLPGHNTIELLSTGYRPDLLDIIEQRQKIQTLQVLTTLKNENGSRQYFVCNVLGQQV